MAIPDKPDHQKGVEANWNGSVGGGWRAGGPACPRLDLRSPAGRGRQGLLTGPAGGLLELQSSSNGAHSWWCRGGSGPHGAQATRAVPHIRASTTEPADARSC